MKNKKLLTIVLLITCFILSSCGVIDSIFPPEKNETETSTEDSTNETETEESNTETNKDSEKESIKESEKESIKESEKESIKESEKESIKESEKESIEESKKESIKESEKENASGKNHNGKFKNQAYDVVTIKEKLYESNDGKKIAFLTFDDGPNNDVTPRILDILKEKNVPATFFTIGKAVNEDTSEILRRIYNEGHAIATHTFSHVYEDLYPDRYPDAEYILKEENKAIGRLQSILGEDFNSRVFRYPGGHMSWNKEGLRASDALLKENNIEWIDWNSMTGDAQPKNIKQVPRPETVQKVLDNFDESASLNGVSDIAVVLMHDAVGKEITVESLGALINHLQDLGYEFGILE